LKGGLVHKKFGRSERIMTVAEIIKIKILAHLKQQQLAVDSLQHESARLEEENAFWKQKADEEEHIKKGRT